MTMQLRGVLEVAGQVPATLVSRNPEREIGGRGLAQSEAAEPAISKLAARRDATTLFTPTCFAAMQLTAESG
jgi:hypothetical protein